MRFFQSSCRTVAVLAFAVVCAGQVHKPEYPDTISIRAGMGPTEVIVADVNGDKKPDLVALNTVGNTVSVLLGTGKGTFEAARDYPVSGQTPSAVAACPLGKGALPDLVTANLGTSDISVLRNDGAGHFNAPAHVQSGAGTIYIACADINGDGLNDLITVSVADSRIHIFLNKKDGSGFSAGITVPIEGVMPKMVVAADINGDGRPDLITSNAGSGSVSVLVNDGKGGFAKARTYEIDSSLTFIAVSDVNNDGHPDVIALSPELNKITVLTNKGDGFFEKGLAVSVRDPEAIAVGDVNGDGRPDLIVAQLSDDSLSILLNDGNGRFEAGGTVAVKGNQISSVAIADLNLDGKQDIITANAGSSDLAVLLQGIRVPKVEKVAVDHSHMGFPVIVANFNTALQPASINDASVLVWGTQTGFHKCDIQYDPTAHTVTIRPKGVIARGAERLGLKPGEIVNVMFTKDILSSDDIPMRNGYSTPFYTKPSSGTGNFAEAERLNCIKIPGKLVAADMDNDGHVDIVALCRELDMVRVHFNDGKAHFTEMLSLPTKGYGPWDLIAADLNRDGLIDIAVVNTFNSTMTIFYNLGGRKFSDPVIIPCGAGPMGIAAADLNGDGWLDLIAVTKGTPEALVFMNDQKGGFRPPVEYRVAPSPYSITPRDVNNDGAIDLTMTNLESDRGTILINNGDGTFKNPEEFPLLLAKALVDDPWDINNDGKTDIVALNTASDDITVLMGSGGGKFTETRNIPVGASPTNMTMGDFDNDGYQDLAISLDGGFVSIMMNNHDGTFRKSVEIPVGQNPTSPVAADFNEDGSLDLMIANQTSHNISILLNAPGTSAKDGGGSVHSDEPKPGLAVGANK